ncbi:translin-associated factor X-interacting protein 1 isoform X1 [Polypterus senegalus]|uniref:translin-associated factor X-interacting protein 1 isoform X1 n=2 Tax=Polypterus senegalus TaxID=55291 RepID=UPI001966CD59|nr:translin-associated factor X-interacting protein 1 isoform X1 [Polypterus senegalus]
MALHKESKLPPLSVLERGSSNSGSSLNAQQQTNDPKHHVLLRGGRTESATGYLSTWPAHMNSQIVLQVQKTQPTNDSRLHGSRYDQSSNVPKPRFLEQLEAYLRKELHAIDMSMPNSQELKLQAYQEVFEYFIEDFKTYKPLLSAIKNEYEVTLAQLRERIRMLEPLRAMLVTLSEQCDQKILALREEERGEMNALKQEKSQLLKCIEQMKEDKQALQTQVAKLQEDLAAQYLLYREECDARKLLIVEISDLKHMQEEVKHSHREEETMEDAVKLKLALKVAREDLTRLQVELNQMRADYGEVVPRRDFEALERDYNMAIKKTETAEKDFMLTKQELDTVLAVHKQVLHEKDQFKVELERLKGTLTPRPNWSKCANVIPGGAEHWSSISEGRTSDQLLNVLLGEIQGRKGKEEDLFIGLGTEETVPVFLRFDGQIRNLKLKKQDLIQVIKEVWEEKVSSDLQKGQRSQLGDFLLEYLQQHHAGAVAEWAYSIYESCQLYKDEEFINLFFNVLTRKVDESVYHGQIHLLTHLLREMTKSDTSESGFLSQQEFSFALHRAFPLKDEEQIEELIQAAHSQLGAAEGNINYKLLFSQGEEGKPGPFLKLVRTQATDEKHQFISELQKELGTSTTVTVFDLRRAFKFIDPSAEEQIVEGYISLVFQTEPENLDKAGPLDISLTISRLSAADVKRTAPLVKQD